MNFSSEIIDKLKFPLGKFSGKEVFNMDDLNNIIKSIENLPALLRCAIEKLNEKQLNTSYRPGGWTLRQIIHHVADSHINGYVRFKVTLTEDMPSIKTFRQDSWAHLFDSHTAPIELSLNLLENLDQRWIILMRSMTEQDFNKQLFHPEIGITKLGKIGEWYAWHGLHHAAQIRLFRQLMKW